MKYLVGLDCHIGLIDAKAPTSISVHTILPVGTLRYFPLILTLMLSPSDMSLTLSL